MAGAIPERYRGDGGPLKSVAPEATRVDLERQAERPRAAARTARATRALERLSCVCSKPRIAATLPRATPANPPSR